MKIDMIRNVVLVGAIAAMLTNEMYSCEDTPGQLSLSVSGATAGSTANYYVVQIPDPNSGDVTVTLTGSGDTPCPDDCECDGDTQAPATDGDPTYDFTHSVGDRDNNVITWTISSGTAPGEYTFRLDQITQTYETCPAGYTGGSSSESNTQASREVTVLACQVAVKEQSDLVLMEPWNLEIEINPSNQTPSNVILEVRRTSETSWGQLYSGTSLTYDEPARVSGYAVSRARVTVSGVQLTTEESGNIEIKFPVASTIAAAATVSSQRASDWSAASGTGGDHNERGGWIYLNTANGAYRVDTWSVGDFFSVSPSSDPSDSSDPCSVPLSSSMDYFVGEYHLHATLRNQDDIENADLYPTGPSFSDISAANASISPSGAPGLLRDRHADEIVATGYTDDSYGPHRRDTISCP